MMGLISCIGLALASAPAPAQQPASLSLEAEEAAPPCPDEHPRHVVTTVQAQGIEQRIPPVELPAHHALVVVYQSPPGRWCGGLYAAGSLLGSEGGARLVCGDEQLRLPLCVHGDPGSDELELRLWAERSLAPSSWRTLSGIPPSDVAALPPDRRVELQLSHRPTE